VMKRGYHPNQSINIRMWMEPGSKKPARCHPDDIKRGEIRRETEAKRDEKYFNNLMREIWDE